jgi:hypothetical protein
MASEIPAAIDPKYPLIPAAIDLKFPLVPWSTYPLILLITVKLK